MKPPPNALSSLPLLAAGGYDIGEVESRESDPGVLTPRVQDHPALPRRTTTASGVRRPTQTPKPFAPALAPRRHGGSGGMIGLVLLLLAVGAAAGWYFFVRKPAVATAPTQLADSIKATAPARQDSLTVAPVDSTWLDFDRSADSVAAAVRVYGVRIRQFDASRIDCTGLSRGLVAVEDSWTEYNVGKKQTPPLDARRVARDSTLYATVDSVGRHFDRSGCPRP
jgi:hypothetical protein